MEKTGRHSWVHQMVFAVAMKMLNSEDGCTRVHLLGLDSGTILIGCCYDGSPDCIVWVAYENAVAVVVVHSLATRS